MNDGRSIRDLAEASEPEDPTASPAGLYLRPEFFELSDYSREGVLRVRERYGKEPLRVRVLANSAERLHGLAVAVDRRADKLRLRLRGFDVGHEDVSVSVADPEAATSGVPAMTVADTADIVSGVGASSEAGELQGPASPDGNRVAS